LNNTIILFDLDGTLIDSTEAILYSFKKAYEKFGVVAPKEEDILPQIGYPLFDMFVNLGVESYKAGDFVLAYKKVYSKVHTKKTTLLPKAKDAVELAYNSGAKLGIVTTKTGKYSWELLEHFGIMHYFSVLIGSEDVKKHKPNPEPIYEALKAFNVTINSKIFMIGDTCMDMIAAKRAKIEAIAVKFKYTSKEELQKCASVVKSGVFEAVTTILNNNS